MLVGIALILSLGSARDAITNLRMLRPDQFSFGSKAYSILAPSILVLSLADKKPQFLMPNSFSGGCACGAIRYECYAKPVLMLKCHCRDCQRASGGGFAAAVLVPADAFRLTQGSPEYHLQSSLAGGQHKRGFCPKCGSPLTGGENTEHASGVVGVLAATLDDPSWFQPQMEIFTSEAQPWDQLDPALRHYPQYPPSSLA